MNRRRGLSGPWMIFAYVIGVIGLCWFAYMFGLRGASGIAMGWLLSVLAIKIFFKKPTPLN
jgi:hypothetical protein